MTTRKPFIKPLELLMLSLGSAIMFPYTYLPIFNTYPKNQDVWVVLLVSIPLIIIFDTPLLYIIKKFRGLTLNQVFDAISGKILGKIAAICYVLFFIMCFFTCMLVAMQFINLSIMVETPMWALLLAALIPITYAASKGPGVVARISVLVVPAILSTIILFSLAGTEFFDLTNIKPIVADSYFLDIIKGAVFTAARFSEISIIFVFSYFLKQGADPIKVYFINILLYVIFFLMILLPVILTLGYTFASRSFNPYFLFTRQVELFNIIEKVQSLNTLAWFPGTLLKLTIYNCMASFIITQMFKKLKHSAVSIALSILVFILALIPAIDKTMVIELLLSDQIMPYVIFIVVTIIPTILLIIYGITKKKVDKKVLNLLAQEDETKSPQDIKAEDKEAKSEQDTNVEDKEAKSEPNINK